MAELETVKSDLATSEAKLAAAEQKLVNLATRSEENDDEATSVESRVETEALKDLKNQIGNGCETKVLTIKKHIFQQYFFFVLLLFGWLFPGLKLTSTEVDRRTCNTSKNIFVASF